MRFAKEELSFLKPMANPILMRMLRKEALRNYLELLNIEASEEELTILEKDFIELLKATRLLDILLTEKVKPAVSFKVVRYENG